MVEWWFVSPGAAFIGDVSMDIDVVRILTWFEHGLSIFAFVVLAKYLVGWVSELNKKNVEILGKYAESSKLDESIKKSLKEALELERDGRKRCEADSLETIEGLAAKLCMAQFDLMTCAGTSEQLSRRLELLYTICEASRESMLGPVGATWNRACESALQGREMFLKQFTGAEAEYDDIFNPSSVIESKPKGLVRLLVMHQRILFECMYTIMNGWRQAVAIPLVVFDEIYNNENVTINEICEKLTSDRLIAKAMGREGQNDKELCNGDSNSSEGN
jgi:hypothetical protein